MYFDTRQLENGTALQTSVCVIGGGAAGITLALEFERRGIDCVLLESGGFKPDAETRDLYRGENVGIPYTFADGVRGRFLGGSTNCWGGWCRPLQEHDLEKRQWVRDSGWPFNRDELTPYYKRAHPILNLGPNNYDAQYWVSAINRPDVRRIPLTSSRVIDRISQFSVPMRMGKLYRDDLRRAKYVCVYLHANVVDIDTDTDAKTVQRVQVRTLNGRSVNVQARLVVLATGGIENARLLLAANKRQPDGLGNTYGLVGRYFMEHPRLILGDVRYRKGWERNKLYDIKFQYVNRAVSANGTFVGAQLTISPETQKQEGLLNGQIWFYSIFPGEYTPSAEAVIRMKHRLLSKADPEHTFLGDLVTIGRRPIDSTNFIVARLLQPRALIKRVQFQMICEPTPNRDSRITLSDARDQLGMPRVRVEWRLDDQVKHTFDRSLQIVGEELHNAGVADVEQHPPLKDRDWPSTIEGTWHHMGTTRMHDSPRQGVVDRNCRVHGMSNLYVAGSSVFPTAGANFPTITIVALSLRLADHIAACLDSPEASIRSDRAHFAASSVTA
jgi:choline dehydrogenase-like flavoprotein